MGYLLNITTKFLEGIIVSAGAHLTLSVTGIFFLAVPVSYASGAYVMVIAQKMGVSSSLAILLSLLFAVFIAILFAMAYTRMSDDSYTVLTLASVIAMDALLKSWDSVTGGVLGISGVVRPEILKSMPALVIGQAILALLVVLIEYLILKSAMGRQLRALKESKTSLSSLGISWKELGSFVVGLAVIMASVSGILTIWRVRYLDPSFSGISILISALTIAVLAHRPKVSYLVAASALVVFLPELLRFFDFSSVILGQMRLMLNSLFIIVMIYFMSSKNLSAKRSY